MVDLKDLVSKRPTINWRELTKEPIIHSHITDCLEDTHPLADKTLFCKQCEVMLHCNNECMQTWLETEIGVYCTKCAPITGVLNNFKKE